MFARTNFLLFFALNKKIVKRLLTIRKFHSKVVYLPKNVLGLEGINVATLPIMFRHCVNSLTAHMIKSRKFHSLIMHPAQRDPDEPSVEPSATISRRARRLLFEGVTNGPALQPQLRLWLRIRTVVTDN